MGDKQERLVFSTVLEVGKIQDQGQAGFGVWSELSSWPVRHPLTYSNDLFVQMWSKSFGVPTSSDKPTSPIRLGPHPRDFI